MNNPARNIVCETQGDRVRVVIDVPIENGDMDDQTMLAKAWALLAERISIEKQQPLPEILSTEKSAPTSPGNAAWWVGWDRAIDEGS